MALLHLGEHCDFDLCHCLDFLPFSCDACHKTFCLDHHKYEAHACPIGRSRVNQECPTCPTCSQIVSIPPNSTPDEALARHLHKNCPKEGVQKSPKCVQCKKPQLIPLRCEGCGCCVCMRHRFAQDHRCEDRKQARKTSLAQPRPKPAAAVPKPVAPELPSSPKEDTISVEIILPSNTLSLADNRKVSPAGLAALRRSQQTQPTSRLVHIKREWTVRTAILAMAAKFNMTPDQLTLALPNSHEALPDEISVDLIADQLQGSKLFLKMAV
eukprot:c3823_g2_i1.p1 GENE.c3823_g2_i1~~c3823_g2_i1.p1  ORF type:complete len:306 (+),score=41.70 c3823_g2_i1:113-919(+)